MKKKILSVVMITLMLVGVPVNNVRAAESVAKRKEKEYETLQAAFDAASYKDTIILLSDNSEDITFKLSSKAVTLDTNDYSFTGTVSGAVASITKDSGAKISYYHTLSEAVSLAESGDTVVLLEDLLDRDSDREVTIKDKDITLDLNGHSIKGSYYNVSAIYLYGSNENSIAHLTVVDNSENKGGCIENTNEKAERCGIYQSGYSVLTLSNVKVKGAYSGIILNNYTYPQNELILKDGAVVEGTNNAGIRVSSNKTCGSKILIEGGTVKGGTQGVILSTPSSNLIMNSGSIEGSSYGVVVSEKLCEVEINGGSINATEDNSTGIYQTGASEISITGESTIKGHGAGIEIRNGTLNVSGGFIEATSDTFSCNKNDNGTTTSGAALAIAQLKKDKNITVNITDGTFKGYKAVNEANIQKNSPKPKVSLSISGGDFWSTATSDQKVFDCEDCDKFVSAGYFSSTFDSSYIISGYKCTEVTDNQEKAEHNNLGYRIGVRTKEDKNNSKIVVDTKENIPAYYENVKDLQDAIDNIIDVNEKKEEENKETTKTNITVTNDSGITAEIDDSIVIVAKTNNENSVTGIVGYNVKEEKDEDKGTSTYSATVLNVGEFVKNDTLQTDGGGKTGSEKIENTSSVKQGATVSTGVLSSAGTVTDTKDNSYLEQIVSEIVNSSSEMSKLKLNQATAAKAINTSDKDIKGNDVSIKATTDGSGKNEVASQKLSIFVKTYYDTEVTEDKTTQADKSFTYDIKPMYQAYASTTDDIEKINDDGVTTVTLGEPKELNDLSGKNITLTFNLPKDFVSSEDQKVYVVHTLANGSKKYYTPTLTKDGDNFKISFENPDGFSSFTFTLNNPLESNNIGTNRIHRLYKNPKTGTN